MIETMLDHPIVLGIISVLLFVGIVLALRHPLLKRWLVFFIVVILLAIFIYLIFEIVQVKLAEKALDQVMVKIKPLMVAALTSNSPDCNGIMDGNRQICGIKLFPRGLESYLCAAGNTGAHWPEDFEKSKNCPVNQSFVMDGERVYQRIGCLRSNQGEILGYYVLTLRQRIGQ